MDDALKALEEKKALLGKLLAETRRQAACIEKGDPEGLGKSIDDAQALMDAIDAADGRIRKGSGFSARSADAAALSADIGSLLDTIRGEHAANIRSAGALKAQYMAGIREANAQRSLQAYAPKLRRTNRYLNRKG